MKCNECNIENYKTEGLDSNYLISMIKAKQSIIELTKKLIFIESNSKENITEQINKDLQNISEEIGAKSCYVFLFSVEEMVFKQTYGAGSDLIQKVMKNKEFLTILYDYLFESLNEKEYIYLSSIKEIPSDAIQEKLLLEECGSCSFAAIPMKTKEGLLGFVCLIDIKNAQDTYRRETCLCIINNLASIFEKFLKRENKIQQEQKMIKEQNLLLENTEIQIWYLKNVSTYGSVNTAHAQFFAKKKETMEHKSIYEIFDEQQAEQFALQNWEVFEKKKQTKAEQWLKDGSGELKLFYLLQTPKLNEQGEVEYVVCTGEDITERHRILKELEMAKEIAEDSERIKAQFLTNMSHEIRTPMNGILGMTQLLLETSLDEEQKELMEIVEQCTNNLMDVVTNILDFSNMESKKLPLINEEFDIRKLIEDFASDSEINAFAKGIEFYKTINLPKILMLKGDPQRLKQILSNLVSNAIKFTKKGSITIKANIESDMEKRIHIKFQVIDTGIGIGEEGKKKIFHAFSQEDGTTSRQYEGLGLGLTLSKRLIELMGGTLDLTSEIGKGSNFWTIIPFEKV